MKYFQWQGIIQHSPYPKRKVSCSSDSIIKMQLCILIFTENFYQKTAQQEGLNYVLHAPYICLCHTISCPWTFLSCFWASAAWRLAWLSWISISFRSPSIFFLILRASFLLLTSESSVLCMESVILRLFLLICSISSSFSASFLSTSPLIWLSSSWTRRILDSSCSRVPYCL